MYLGKNFVFPNFHFLTPWPPLTSIYLKMGEPKKFKNGLKSFHLSHPSICTVNLFWVRRLIQMSSPDSSAMLHSRPLKLKYARITKIHPLAHCELDPFQRKMQVLNHKTSDILCYCPMIVFSCFVTLLPCWFFFEMRRWQVGNQVRGTEAWNLQL